MERYVKMYRDGTSPVPGDWIKPLSHLPILDKGESIAILCLCGN